MDLGAFSVSLTVKDLGVSREFYEKLGFEKFHGEEDQGWLIMKSGTTVIGLFQGMFDKNIMTFNPGWDATAAEVNPFDDVRVLKKRFAAAGLEILAETGEGDQGPASFSVLDPDGNPILFDQHR